MDKYEEIDFYDSICKGRRAYDNIASLQNRIICGREKNLQLNVYSEGRLGNTFLFMIRCMPLLASSHNMKMKLCANKNTLPRLNRLNYIETPERATNDSILLLRNVTNIIAAQKIVTGIPAKLSERLHEDMVSRIGEIFNNASDHSQAKDVAVSRYSKPRKKYCFVCYDTGIGIPQNVRNFLSQKNNELSDADAIRWALQPGNTTTDIAPRGQGLSLLRSFAEVNRGTIRICTGNILYTYDCNGVQPFERFDELENKFYGTLFEMDIKAFDGMYKYKGE